MATSTTASNKKPSSSYEILAQFNAEINSRTYEMQKMRSGLLSTHDAARAAVFEKFSKAYLDLNASIEYTKLLGCESKEEQLQAMKDFVASSSGSTKEASDIVENMLDRFSTEYQMTKSHNVGPSTEQVNNVQNVEKESRKEKEVAVRLEKMVK